MDPTVLQELSKSGSQRGNPPSIRHHLRDATRRNLGKEATDPLPHSHRPGDDRITHHLPSRRSEGLKERNNHLLLSRGPVKVAEDRYLPAHPENSLGIRALPLPHWSRAAPRSLLPVAASSRGMPATLAAIAARKARPPAAAPPG